MTGKRFYFDEPKPDEIVENLFLGSVADAKNWPGVRLCVLEKHESCNEDLEATERGEKGKHFPLRKNDIWIPVIQHVGNEYCVVKSQLEKAAQVIDDFQKRGEPLLTHCRQGMERSPLTLAYWLTTRKGMSMDEAYTFLQERRIEVERRNHWLCGSKSKEYTVEIPLTKDGEEFLWTTLYPESQVLKVKRKKNIEVRFSATPAQADRVVKTVKDFGGKVVKSRTDG